MNLSIKEISKKALVFAIILGAVIGIVSVIPIFIGLSFFILTLLSAPIVMIFMRTKGLLYTLDAKKSALVGALIGASAIIGFFFTFSPLVCIVKLIFKSYYAYMLPQMITSAMWLFFAVIFMVAFVFALTNSATAMGVNWLYSYIESLDNKEINETQEKQLTKFEEELNNEQY